MLQVYTNLNLREKIKNVQQMHYKA